MMNELQALIPLLETVGPFGTLILVAMILRPVLMRWLENIAERNRMEAQRNTAEIQQSQELATVLSGVQAQLQISTGVNNQLIAKFNALPTRTDIEQAGQAMMNWAHQHESRLTLVHNDIKATPAEVWRVGSPKLDALRQGLEQYLDNLRGQIVSALDPSAENARKVVEREFEGLFTRLDSIEWALRQLAPRPETPDEGPEQHVAQEG